VPPSSLTRAYVVLKRRVSASSVLYLLVGLVFGAFVVSTLPGVRSHAGYSLFFDGVLNNVAYALSAVVCFLRARRAVLFVRSYRLLGVGLALYGAGNIFWTIFIRTQDPEPFPSAADALWLSFYGFAFIALWLIVREIAEGVPVSLWLDGVVAGLAVAGVAAAFIGPVLAITGGSTAEVVTTLAYPLLDVLLLLVVTAMVALFQWRPPMSLWFLVGGLVIFCYADAAYLFSATNGTYHPGGLNDSVWVVATLVIGFAPGRAERASGVMLPDWARLALPVGATVCALAALVYGTGHTLNEVAVSLCATTVVSALVRLIVTFREATSLADSHELAHTDELTGLGNRRSFYDNSQLHLAPGSDAGAMLLLDLDRFKEVNDSLGHHAGDTLLKLVADRLRKSLDGAGEVLTRLGGDEFSVLLVGVDSHAAETVALAIRDALEPPFSVDGVTLRVNASIGISLFPAHGHEVSTLLRRADIAMYQAKASRVGYYVYTPATDSPHEQNRLRTLEELRSAILGRKLEVHYQPKLNATTLAVNGVEALVRWQHPTRGLLLPDAFLPLVEDSGLMQDLTDAVLELSLDQVRRWRDSGRQLSVAVNLSASSLVDADLPQRIWEHLCARQLPADALELEITEDFLMADRVRAREILTELRRLGIRVAVDDFGTGYSSLAYLRELPIDELKLDRSFVQPMADDPKAAAIVRSTIDLAHSLGMTMVAEGVEDEYSATQLALSNCDTVQGFLFSKALPAADLEHWMDQRKQAALPQPSGTALRGIGQ
jgi:diguanylate cyclase (GGDEF)-like protein